MNNYGVSYNSCRSGKGMVETVVYAKLNDVEYLLTELRDRIAKKGHATLYDYYKLIGATVLPDDSKWGWDNLIETTVTLTRRGYELHMPVTVCVGRDPVREAYEILQSADEDCSYDAVIEAVDCLNKAL